MFCNFWTFYDVTALLYLRCIINPKADMTIDEINNSNLSDDAKFLLEQFTDQRIRCGCGNGLVNKDGEIPCIDLPETIAPLEKEIDESGLATVTIRVDDTVSLSNGLVRYYALVCPKS